MPHFVVDYSANLHDRLDFQTLFKDLHDYVVSTGEFPIGGARSRAIRCDDYRVADGRGGAEPDRATTERRRLLRCAYALIKPDSGSD